MYKSWWIIIPITNHKVFECFFIGIHCICLIVVACLRARRVPNHKPKDIGRGARVEIISFGTCFWYLQNNLHCWKNCLLFLRNTTNIVFQRNIVLIIFQEILSRCQEYVNQKPRKRAAWVYHHYFCVRNIISEDIRKNYVQCSNSVKHC